MSRRRGDDSPHSADPSRRLGEIVLTAAGLDGGEREDYLNALAEEEPELAGRARARLAAAADLPDSFLETPAADRLEGAVAEAESAPAPGGLPLEERYELGEHLGQGGMGRVVKAFDRQLGRPVALKLLTHDDPQVLALFLREARAQARVQHPHVLDVYDSGELGGQPFIAMRYVASGTLADLPPTVSLEQRVRLLAQVAEGLHAAHREGLLHRDVKPSNVLVDRTADGELVALVTDFGLATELADADALVAEAVAGSPHYIAPERLAGPGARPRATVDRRSDVYSLGVTLYRVLTGALPFEGQETFAVLRRVAEEDLPSPRERLPSIPKELAAITRRCTARDPQERYASARAVAADLERYLDGEVVEAYAAGLAYRLTRFVLRNRLLAGMAVVVAVTALVAAVAVAVFAVRADAARQRAEARQGQAEELIRFMVVDLRDKLASLRRLDILSDVGDAATEYFAAVPEAELSEAELLRRSRTLYQVGEVRIQQGDLAGAAAPLGESLALARRLAQLRPEDGERLFELGQAYFWVGYVHWELGELGAARPPLESYLEISRQLVSKDPGNLDWRRELSYAHSNLGSLLQAEGDLRGALEQFRATLALDEELTALDPENLDARFELAATHNLVAVLLQDLGELAEAGEHLRADLEIRDQLMSEDPVDPRRREFFGAAHGHLGLHLFHRGQPATAGEHFEEMRRITAELVEHDPTNTAWRYQLAWSHLNLGRVALAVGDSEAAGTALDRQRELIDELLTGGEEPHRWRRTRATGLYHLALLRRARGESGAEEAVGSAIAILEELAAARPTDRSVRRWLARAHLLSGNLEGGSPGRVAFAHAARALEPMAHGHRDGRVLAPWATALRCLGRHPEAQAVEEELQEAGYAEPDLGAVCSVLMQ